MNHKELLKELEKRMSRYGYCDTQTHIEMFIKEYESVTKDEKTIRLKDVIKRIKGFEDGTKLKWTYDILKELGSDFSSKMFHQGYQQGRFDEAIETHYEPEKVKVSEEEAKFLETFDFNCESDVTTALYLVSRTGWGYELTDRYGTELKHLTRETRLPKNKKRLIKAILDGYEVEKEKRYTVVMKGISSLFRHLKYSFLTEKWYMGNDTENEDVKKTHTRKEIENAGFGEVFNSPLFEIEEVE